MSHRSANDIQGQPNKDVVRLSREPYQYEHAALVAGVFTKHGKDPAATASLQRPNALTVQVSFRSAGTSDLWIESAAIAPSAAAVIASCEPGVMSPAANTL